MAGGDIPLRYFHLGILGLWAWAMLATLAGTLFRGVLGVGGVPKDVILDQNGHANISDLRCAHRSGGKISIA